MINIFSERILLIVFIIVNIALYSFSYDGATFVEGADSSQYYLPALSFLENGKFVQGDVSLTFGPPLYSIFLAIPIYVFGFDESDAAIVFIQCTLLYLTGVLSRQILLQFPNKLGLLVHALIIFNPNSIITAHLVQSETLFTFLFIWSIIVAFKIINNFSLKRVILLGFLTGLAALTRPVAIYLLLLWPMFILISLIVKNKLDIGNQFIFYRKREWMRLLSIMLIGGMVVSPWYARNYIEFGKAFFTSNAGAYLQAQYIQLKNKGFGYNRADAMKEHRKIFSDYLGKKKLSNFCLNNDRHWSCNGALTSASLSGIVSEPLVGHAKALVNSWGALFFSGGASNIRNYLRIDGKELIVSFQKKSFNGLKSILNLIREMPTSYLIIFIFTTIFSTISRIIGIVGIFYLIKEKRWRPYGLLLIETVSLFTAAYLYLGQSRFRVPLEPILMIFTVVGILFMIKKSNK